MIGVIDYGAGNLGSVMNAFERLRIPARFVAGPEELSTASGAGGAVPGGTYGGSPFAAVVFPGDGHFGTAMASLAKSGYADAIRQWIRADKPFLGICIGLQLLFDSSEEAPGVRGLGVLGGTVRLFPGRKVPQIGWNRTSARERERERGPAAGARTGLFAGLPSDSFFYYIHSYYVDPADKRDIAAEAEYYLSYCAAAERGALAATQFHPEKSGTVGLELLKNWAGGAHAR